jgi:O-antigen ligase
MITTIIRYFYYILFLLTPLVMYSKTSELFEFNKMIFIYLITSSVVCLWLLDAAKKGKFEIVLHWSFVPALFFLASQIMSTLFSIDPHTSVFGYYGRFNGGLLSISCYLALLFVYVQVADRSFVRNSLKVAFVAGVIVVLWGLPGRYGYDVSCLIFTGQLTNACWTDQFRPAERMFSTLGQPNWLGAYLNVIFFIGMWFFAMRDRFRNRSTLLLGLALVVVFAGILFTRSRSGLLAWGAGMALFGAGYAYFRRDVFRARIPALATFLVALAIPVLVYGTGVDSVDRFVRLPMPGSDPAATGQTITPETPARDPSTTSGTPAASEGDTSSGIITVGVTDSFDIRKIVWKGAVDLANRYPLFGTGVETYAYAYYFTRPSEHNQTSEWDFLYNKAHNEFLNYLSTTGYVGLFAYLTMIVSVLVLFIRTLIRTRGKGSEADAERMLMVSLTAGYVTILVTNFFGFSISVVQVLFYLLPAFAVAFAPEKDIRRETYALPRAPLFRKVAQGVAMLSLVLSVIYLGRYYLADVTYASADSLARSGEYEESFRLYKQALALRYEHVYEDKFSSVLSNLAFISSYQSDKELSRELIDLANTFNDRTLKASPKNVLYWKTKAKNQYLHYQTTLDAAYLGKAVEAMKQAEALSPTDPKLPYTTALFYSLLHDEEDDAVKKEELKQKSLEAIGKTVSLKPDYREGQLLKAQLQSKYGDTEGARTTLNFILKKIAPGDQETLQELETLDNPNAAADQEQSLTQ